MEISVINLPDDFLKKMELLLGTEYKEFLKGYDNDRQYGLRMNPLKVQKDIFEQMDFGFKKVPWAKEGYYYNPSFRPGKHPYHEAGVYYIQEPSAMAVAELLDVQPGENVLDLCAAPGGKSTQIAGKMQGMGLLVSNEINPQRVKILSQNIERMGIKNAVVLNEDSDILAQRFPQFFDKILVDAPCSGEGMFRKDENAVSEWSSSQVEKCAKRQKMILDNAAVMLKAGGILVYSTCTFSPEENECVISEFIKKHSEFEVCDCTFYDGFDYGRAEYGGEEVSKTIRLWPHRLGGEGHFAAKLIKRDGEDVHYESGQNYNKRAEASLYKKFAAEYLNSFEPEGDFLMFGEQLYSIPKSMPSLKGLKAVRPGLHLGINKKNRFEPAHALAMALAFCDAVNVKDMDIELAEKYLKGEVIQDDGYMGWTLMTVDSFSLGWGKASSGMIKNHYPKGLRICNF